MPTTIKKLSHSIIGALLLLGMCTTQVLAEGKTGRSFNEVYVFGDSLSDPENLSNLTNGFLPATAPPYVEGRFSNGRLWVEFLSLFLNVDDTENRAVGGAFTDTRNANTPLAPEVAGTGILGQVAQFEMDGGRIGRRDLTIVWGGANDYFGELDPNPAVIVGNLKQAVRDLARLGGRVFLVPNLPNLGDTPLAIDLGLQAQFNALTSAHNERLAKVMRHLERKLGVRIIVLDVNTAFDGIDEFISNVTVPCIIQDPPFEPFITGVCPIDPETGVPDSTVDGGTLYMDVIHPTTQPHRLLAAYAFGVLSGANQKHKRRY